MAVGTVSGIDPTDNWQLIATNTPSAATSSTFSSISGYKKLMLVFSGSQSTGANMTLQFNGDTTASNYGGAQVLWSGLGTYSAGAAFIPFTGYNDAINPQTQYAIIDYANASTPKLFSVGGSKTTAGTGIYIGSAITSIVLAVSSGTITGTVYLYGIAA